MVFNRDLYLKKLIRIVSDSYQQHTVYGRYPHNETPAAFSVAGVPLIVVSKVVVVINSKIVVVMPYF